MEIPKRIRVGRHLYSVDVVEAMLDKCYGKVYYNTKSIRVHKRKPACMADTFWHETVHAILYEMGHPLYRNERFVTDFSDKLSKAIKSAEFQ